MKAKNLLFICAHYPKPGGVETVTGLLADFFQAHDYKVFIAVLNQKQVSLERHQHHQQLVTMPGPMNTAVNLAFLDEFIHTKQIDCVFNQGVFSQIHLHAAQHPQTIFINTLHSRPFWEVYEFLNSKWWNKQHIPLQTTKNIVRHLLGKLHPAWALPNINRFYRNQIECANWYVVLDETFKKELEVKLYQGLPQNKIRVIPNPIRQTMPLQTSKKKEVLYIGRLKEEPKRVDRLLRIWARIEEEFKDWSLQIVGDGKDRKKLEDLAGSLQLQHCHFHGYQEPTTFYQSASILCLTSTYEGSPMVIPEAQSHGIVPVVFGSVQSLYSLIDDGMNGLIVPPFDEQAFAEELSKLIRDHKRLEYLSENARKKVQEHDLETIGRSWLRLMESSSEQHPGQAPQSTTS